MSSKPIKMPGPDHPITIEGATGRIVVTVAGQVIADSRDALILKEANHPGVPYFPRKDVKLALLERSDHATWCPYKGDCSYYSIPSGGARGVNAIWTYEVPHDAVARIKDHMAFYPDRVDRIEQR